jgi:hypothetical protein
MLILTAVALLFTPRIGNQTVDPAMDFIGENISNLLMHLLVIWFCCWIVIALHGRDWSPRRLWYWRALCLTGAAIVLITYWPSDQFRVEADEFALGDIGSSIQYWVVSLTIAIAFAIVAITAAANLFHHGPDTTITMACTLPFGIAGFIVGATTLVLLAVNPAWLHENYRNFADRAATVGLVCLALSGVPGLVGAWTRRLNPR